MSGDASWYDIQYAEEHGVYPERGQTQEELQERYSDVDVDERSQAHA